MMPLSVSAASAERLQHGEDLRHDQGAVPVPAVDPHAGDRSEEEHRDLRAETDDAQQDGRPRQPVDQPTGGDAGHPRADQRDGLSAEKQPVVPGFERAQREGETAHTSIFPDAAWNLRELSYTVKCPLAVRQGPAGIGYTG